MKKAAKIVIRFLLLLNVLAILALGASYAAAYINPAKYWHFAFFGLSYPIILIVNLFFMLLWLILWKKYFFLSLIVILAGFQVLQGFIPSRFSSPPSHPGEKVKIVTYNVNLFSGNSQKAEKENVTAGITKFISDKAPDILCIQEFHAEGPDSAVVLKAFGNRFGLHYHAFANYRKYWNKQKMDGIVTYSRFPIVHSGYFNHPERHLFCVYTDVVMDMDTIRIYNLHLESIRFGTDDYNFYTHLIDLGEDPVQLKDGTKKMFWKLRKAFIFRAREVDVLLEHMALSPYPMIVAGDFNDTPSSYTYAQLTRDLTDAYKSAGTEFFGSTYAGKFPAFRIDYILFSGIYEAEDYRKYKIDLSDHYPVTALLVINK